MIQLVDVLQGWYKLPLQISFQNGTCYTVEECNRRNGINSGSCAGGYGVCCACMFAVLPTLTICLELNEGTDKLWTNWSFTNTVWKFQDFFLPFRFYVKSNLDILEVQKLLNILAISNTLEFDFWKSQPCKNAQIS